MADPPSDKLADGTPRVDGDDEPPAHDSAAFAPPRAESQVLALEPEWERARAEKQAAAAVPAAKPPEPRRARGTAVAVIAVIAGAAAIGAWLLHRRPAQRARVLETRAIVEIRVRADRPAEIRIDGHRAGKTPLTLDHRTSATPIRIEATIGGMVQTRVVVPDRDRDVDFTAP